MFEKSERKPLLVAAAILTGEVLVAWCVMLTILMKKKRFASSSCAPTAAALVPATLLPAYWLTYVGFAISEIDDHIVLWFPLLTYALAQSALVLVGSVVRGQRPVGSIGGAVVMFVGTFVLIAASLQPPHREVLQWMLLIGAWVGVMVASVLREMCCGVPERPRTFIDWFASGSIMWVWTALFSIAILEPPVLDIVGYGKSTVFKVIFVDTALIVTSVVIAVSSPPLRKRITHASPPPTPRQQRERPLPKPQRHRRAQPPPPPPTQTNYAAPRSKWQVNLYRSSTSADVKV